MPIDLASSMSRRIVLIFMLPASLVLNECLRTFPLDLVRPTRGIYCNECLSNASAACRMQMVNPRARVPVVTYTLEATEKWIQ